MPEGEVYVAIESPRGELGCYLVSDGGPKPYRMHIRGPSFVNLQGLPAHDARRPAGRRRGRVLVGRPGDGGGGPVTDPDPGGRPAVPRRRVRPTHLSADIVARARQLIALYPEPRSALIPLCHLAQEQDGWLTPEAMVDIAEPGRRDARPRCWARPSFYDMLHTEPVGHATSWRCAPTSPACSAGPPSCSSTPRRRSGVGAGGTTADGVVTLEEAECLADCDRAPCVQVNHRYVGAQTPERFDRLIGDLRSGARDADIPPHGTLIRVRRTAGLEADPADGGRASGRGRGRGAGPPARPPAGRRGEAPDGDHRRRRRSSPPGMGYDDSHTLERYLATGGYDGLRKALAMTPEAVAAEVDAASLLGRGGAGFPAGRKWSMLRKNPVTYLVVNGDESRAGHLQGPPADRAGPAPAHRGRAHRRLRPAGHPGVHLPARRVRPRASSGCRPRSTRPTPTARWARDIFGSGFSVDVVVHPGAGAYICGEETALLESLEGKRGFPRIKPPFFPAAIGLYGEPTVVNNVETMSNLPWIITNGGAAFAALGRRPVHRDPAVRPGRPRAQPGRLRARDGQDHLPRPDQRPGAGRRHPARPRAQGVHPRRRVGPVVRARPDRPAPRARTRWPRPAPCSARARSWSWTTTPAWCGPPGASPSSSRASRAGSARRAARARAGSSGSWSASRRGQGREEDLDLLHGRLRQHLARRGLAAAADHHLRARPVHPVVDQLGHPHVPRRVPGPHQGGGLPLWLTRPTPATGPDGRARGEVELHPRRARRSAPARARC